MLLLIIFTKCFARRYYLRLLVLRARGQQVGFKFNIWTSDLTSYNSVKFLTILFIISLHVFRYIISFLFPTLEGFLLQKLTTKILQINIFMPIFHMLLSYDTTNVWPLSWHNFTYLS